MDNEFINSLNKEITEVNLQIGVLMTRRNALEALRETYNAVNSIQEPDPSTVVANTWEEPSARDPNTLYRITEYGDGNVTCTCPGFKYRGECKHVW